MSLANSLLHGFCIIQMLAQSQSLMLCPARTQQGIGRAAGFCQVTTLRQKKTEEQGSSLRPFKVSRVQVAVNSVQKGGGGGEVLKLD